TLAWAAPAPPVKYKKRAERTAWQWDETRASIEDSARRCRGVYQAQAAPDSARSWAAPVHFTRDGKVVYTRVGNFRTVFVVRGDVLYWADFCPSSSGCTLIAIDLTNRKELWKTELRGLGAVDHSKYHNAVNLDLDRDTVRVFGKESYGRYVEYVHCRTGKT